jgi:hypothetical protein
MIRMSVLRWQTSHLLLIRTNLGYGTILIAACAHQGCHATDYLLFYLFITTSVKPRPPIIKNYLKTDRTYRKETINCNRVRSTTTSHFKRTHNVTTKFIKIL